MAASIGDNYREADILTAPPQRLHLFLVEGALRFIERARQFWQQNNFDAGFEAVIKAQEIIAEILAGIKVDSGLPLARQVAAVYSFVYRCLVQAAMTREQKPLEDALRVLAIERETWQELCRRLASSGGGKHSEHASADQREPLPSESLKREPLLPHQPKPARPYSARDLTNSASSGYAGEYAPGFSWEA